MIANSGISAAAIANAIQTQFTAKEPITFGIAGVRFLLGSSGSAQPYLLMGGGVARVKKDVTFTVDAYPGRIFHGLMTHVRLYAQSVNNVVTYQAIVAVKNPDLKLLPSMTATMTKTSVSMPL